MTICVFLFSNIGIAHCPICKQKVSRQSVDEIINDVEKKVNINDKLIVLSPVVIDKKGSLKSIYLITKTRLSKNYGWWYSFWFRRWNRNW